MPHTPRIDLRPLVRRAVGLAAVRSPPLSATTTSCGVQRRAHGATARARRARSPSTRAAGWRSARGPRAGAGRRPPRAGEDRRGRAPAGCRTTQATAATAASTTEGRTVTTSRRSAHGWSGVMPGSVEGEHRRAEADAGGDAASPARSGRRGRTHQRPASTASTVNASAASTTAAQPVYQATQLRLCSAYVRVPSAGRPCCRCSEATRARRGVAGPRATTQRGRAASTIQVRATTPPQSPGARRPRPGTGPVRAAPRASARAPRRARQQR